MQQGWLCCLVYAVHKPCSCSLVPQSVKQPVMCTLALLLPQCALPSRKGFALADSHSIIVQGLSGASCRAGKVGSDGKVVCGCALCKYGVSQCVSEFEKHGRSGANRPAQNVCLAALSEEADHEISLGVSAYSCAAACMAGQCEGQFSIMPSVSAMQGSTAACLAAVRERARSGVAPGVSACFAASPGRSVYLDLEFLLVCLTVCSTGSRD